MSQSPIKDYKDTLNLPQTDFPMRASLPEREPAQVEEWLKADIYHRLVEKNKANGGKKFLLHDGPPYANGNIHIGHTLNKVLKDIVVKFKSMSGNVVEYVPGWDCHGLPIELGVEKQIKDQKLDKAQLPITKIREMCREYAMNYISLQRDQFKRLEIFGEWENPYFTMSKEYVASIIRQLGKCADNGFLYRGNKPVYWCPTDATALAEAEIEYADKESTSIYVKFDLPQQTLDCFHELRDAAQAAQAKKVSIIIWTTTPWTLPANLGLAFGESFNYSAFLVEGEVWITATDLRDTVLKAAGIDPLTVKEVLNFKPEKLHGKVARHPFLDRESLIIFADHVTLDAGTGIVHTAPGHGVEDYQVGKKYGLEVYAPVDHRGRYTDKFPLMAGESVFKANEPIVELLKSSGHLVAAGKIQHSYAHCWRCNKPVIFRATPQWFIGMDHVPEGMKNSLRKTSIEAIHATRWIPEWGMNRILGMMESRPDWCISRQRVWGVPITVFYCEKCDEAKVDSACFEHVAAKVHEQGPDIWFTEPAEKLHPAGMKCDGCGNASFRKETDILDVWFDSGVSHAAVCEARGLGWPADLYLEGSDQHRGWFQTSLLTAIATKGTPPFRSVLTHGFVNDQHGKKMSKSKGNVVSPLDLMKTHGAEILRLWVASEDYRSDLKFSKETLTRVSDNYRKFRNTIRFLLGNLHDFKPDQHLMTFEKMGELDRWALSTFSKALDEVLSAYDEYQFHQAIHSLNNLCNVELSSVYFDILKDRLYTARKDSDERRSSQTAMYLILEGLLSVLAPVLSFTAEEAWLLMPKGNKTEESVLLADFPSVSMKHRQYRHEELEKKFDFIWSYRDNILKALEVARNAKEIGHPREARVIVELPKSDLEKLRSISEDLTRLFLVSQLKFQVSDQDPGFKIEKIETEKCARCWVHAETVGQDSGFADLCDRCVGAVN